MNRKVAYIAGKITGEPNYKEKFQKVADKYIAKGFTVLNPAILPESEHISQDNYMTICLSMLKVSDIIVMLPDWESSVGATMELSQAYVWKKEVIKEKANE